MNNLKEKDTLVFEKELESGVLYKEIFLNSFFDFTGELVHEDYLTYQKFAFGMLNDIICNAHQDIEGEEFFKC